MGISLLIKGLLSSSLTNQLSMLRAGYRKLITLFRFTELQLRMFEVYLCVNINLLFNVGSMNAEGTQTAIQQVRSQIMLKSCQQAAYKDRKQGRVLFLLHVSEKYSACF